MKLLQERAHESIDSMVVDKWEADDILFLIKFGKKHREYRMRPNSIKNMICREMESEQHKR